MRPHLSRLVPRRTSLTDYRRSSSGYHYAPQRLAGGSSSWKPVWRVSDLRGGSSKVHPPRMAPQNGELARPTATCRGTSAAALDTASAQTAHLSMTQTGGGTGARQPLFVVMCVHCRDCIPLSCRLSAMVAKAMNFGLAGVHLEEYHGLQNQL